MRCWKAKNEMTDNTVQLQKIRLGMLVDVASKDFYDADVTVYQQTMDKVQIAITGYVWGENGKWPSEHIEYPRDWWQALKERWYPAWAKKRWPIRYIHYVYDVSVIYPEFEVAMPDEKHKIVSSCWGYETIDDND